MNGAFPEDQTLFPQTRGAGQRPAGLKVVAAAASIPAYFFLIWWLRGVLAPTVLLGAFAYWMVRPPLPLRTWEVIAFRVAALVVLLATLGALFEPELRLVLLTIGGVAWFVLSPPRRKTRKQEVGLL